MREYVVLPRWKALEVVIRNHYLHRACPVSWAFGIEIDGEIRGALTVGKPISSTACAGVCGVERSKDVYELNRLWVHDSLPQNSESRFLGFCLRHLRKCHPSLILLSYADSAATNLKGEAHVGYIYQATNWLYTGQSAPWSDQIKIGKVNRSPKHRYVWFATKGDNKLLRWKEQPYPKRAATAPPTVAPTGEI